MATSEFGGEDTPNGLQPEVPEALSPKGMPPEGGHSLTSSEQLRLIYTTGQTDDPTMRRVKGAFKGGGVQP